MSPETTGQSQPDDDRRTVRVPHHVIEAGHQAVRCVHLASGLTVYEFAMGAGTKIMRVNADRYDEALAAAREKPHYEVVG